MSKPKGKSSNAKPRGRGFKPSQPRKDSDSRRVNFDNTRESKFERDIEEGTKKSGRNDITTWNRNPELMRAAGSLPFSTILGDPYGKGTAGSSMQFPSVPGIMTMYWSPSLGSSSDPVAFNKCFEAAYSFMVHANSRNYKYDFPDLAVYITGAEEVFSAIAEAIRIYGIFKAYDSLNRYYVDSVVSALGWYPKDVRLHLSDMWFGINDLILQTRQLWIPNDIPIIQRWVDLNSHIYLDAEGSRAQSYAFVRNRYWKVSETGSKQGTTLVPAVIDMNATTSTPVRAAYSEFSRIASRKTTADVGGSSIYWYQFRSMIQDMIDSLVASQDRGSIYGDILTAYGAPRIYAMPEITADYTVKPEYNAAILSQIENLTVSPIEQRFVVQNQAAANKGRLYMAPVWYNILPDSETDKFTQPVTSSSATGKLNVIAAAMAPTSQILNAHFQGQPSPEFIMEATRFKVGAATQGEIQILGNTPAMDSATGKWTGINDTTVTNNGVFPSSCGTETVVWVSITRLQYDAGGGRLTYTDDLEIFKESTAATPRDVKAMERLMAFDWHPFVYDTKLIWTGNSTDSKIYQGIELVESFGDFDNYIEMDDVVLSKLHATALYSAFGVPMSIK